MKFFHANKRLMPVIMTSTLVLLSLLTAVSAFAAPGDFDTDFVSPDGYDILDLGNQEYGSAVAVQTDGKIVVGGYRYNTTSSKYEFLVARYDSDGALDTTGFGSPNGYVTTAIGDDDYLYGLAIQSDGKIVVAGYATVSSQKVFTVVRYNTDGSLDSDNFGYPNGYVTTDVTGGSYDNRANAVAIQSDGKIVVAGFCGTSSTGDDFTVVRYNTDGSLDTTGFGGGSGYTITDIQGESDQAYAMAIQSGGEIVVGGSSYNGSSYAYEFAVARYTTAGSLDTSGFGNPNGFITTAFTSSYNSLLWGVAVQKDDKIVAVGQADSGTKNDLALARYNSDGSLDTTGFGSGTGKKLSAIGSSGEDRAAAVAIQADGKLLLAGYTYLDTSYAKVLLARYSTGGTLDTSEFGSSNGYVTSDLGNSSAHSNGEAVAIQPKDGKIVITGQHYNGSNYDLFVSRFQVAISETGTIVNGGSDTLADVGIINNSGSSCDFTVIKYPVPPGGIPADAGEMPVQWNITSTCSPVNLDLSFQYTSDEVANANNVTEANLVAFRNAGSGWINQCSSNCDLYTDDNYLDITGVTSLSSWTLGDPTTSGNTDPTSVEVKSVRGISGTQTGIVVALVGICASFAALIVRKKLIKTYSNK